MFQCLKRAILEKKVGDMSAYANSIGDLLGAVANYQQEQIEQDLKNGKISEKEAQKRFEKTKKLQIAQAIISTLTGAVEAYMKAQATYPPPMGIILGAINAATVTIAGMMNVNKIKSTTIGGSSSLSSSSNSGGQASVSAPAMEMFKQNNSPRIEENDLKNIQTEEITNSIQNQKVYVLESDISDEINKNKVRVAETSW